MVHLENLVFDAADPRTMGRFWEAVLGTTTLTDRADVYVTRLSVAGGPVLNLRFPQVWDATVPSPRLHLDLRGGAEQQQVVQRLLGLGASHLDIGQGAVPWVVLADPEGHAFCVMEERDAYRDTGPVAAIPILGPDHEMNARFWAEMTGWRLYDGAAPVSLRHASMRGVILEFFPAPVPKRGKNRMHLDLRLESGDDASSVLDLAREMGAAPLDHSWGELPWTVLTDPSGNEFCILPAQA